MLTKEEIGSYSNEELLEKMEVLGEKINLYKFQNKARESYYNKRQDYKLLKEEILDRMKNKMVGGTGIEPATSAL